MPLLPRATTAADNGSGPPTALIVGVVCGVLGGALLALFAARAVLRLRLFRPRPAPLPPVQELAHHRAAAQHASLVRARAADADWLAPRSSYGPAPSAEGSAVSLVRHAGAVASASPSPVGWEHDGLRGDQDLPVPHRPFLEHRQSLSASSEGSLPSSPGTPASEASDSVRHVAHASSSGSLATRSRSRPRHSRVPSRPHSAHSSGPPHSRRNTMQIVLPAPLAPQLENWAARAVGADPLQPPPPPRMSHRASSTISDSPSIDSWVQRPLRSPSRERVDDAGGHHSVSVCGRPRC
jgi:hypothetical protein